MATRVFYSHGKLLLTAEYLVLDGARALALPTNKGQYLAVSPITLPKLIWKSYDDAGTAWYEESFLINDLTNIKTAKEETKVLIAILMAAQELNPSFLKQHKGYRVSTRLTFNRKFGLGSSSTLIANIAQWAGVNPYQLLQKSFPGSGYDIACATHSTALVYQYIHQVPKVTVTIFKPAFKEQLFFVYLNKKQSSREGIAYYKKIAMAVKTKAVNKINALTAAILSCNELHVFEGLIDMHEKLMAEVLQMPTVKERLFADYSGSIKSLGAWGGDFVLVSVTDKSDLNYFKEKGYTSIFSFTEMVLN